MVVFKLSRRPQVRHNEVEVAMKQHDITKLCADALRSYVSSRSSISPLKSSHAHEIMAAFFGYKSKIALHADTQHPISNLNQADIIVLPPHNEAANTIFQQRRKDLQINAFDEYDVSNIVSDVLKNSPIYGEGLEDIARAVARGRLIQRFKTLGIDSDQLNLIVEITDSDIRSSETSFTVSVDYISDNAEKTLRDSTITVTFPRIAGHVGYKEPDVQETRYSGKFRLTNNQNKPSPQWPYPAGTLVMRRDTKEIGVVLKAEAGNTHGGSIKICTDTSLDALVAKEEVFPLADQSMNFIPLRLFMPYGKYVCQDETEVLYNRDYRPLWKKELDGTVTPINSDAYIDHYKREGFFNEKNTPTWGNADTICKIGLPILQAWGVENKRPQILDLLPQAIAAGSADLLRQKY